MWTALKIQLYLKFRYTRAQGRPSGLATSVPEKTTWGAAGAESLEHTEKISKNTSAREIFVTYKKIGNREIAKLVLLMRSFA
jgi:hypothetical protein